MRHRCYGAEVIYLKPDEAQMLWCWGDLFETWWSTDVMVLRPFILFLVLRCKTELCSKCVADSTQDTEEEQPLEAHGFKLRLCGLWGSQRVGMDSQNCNW